MDLTPDAWLAGAEYKAAAAGVTANSFVIPIASTDPAITSAEADASTGDIREVMWKIIATLLAAQEALSAANKPAYFKITQETPKFNNAGQMVDKYVMTFIRDVDSTDAPAE